MKAEAERESGKEAVKENGKEKNKRNPVCEPLSPRLQAVADMIPAGVRVADIGTDHACLAVYLIRNGRALRVIASDRSPGSLATARRTVNSYGLREKIELRLGEGLKVLRAGEVEIVVIAGLGGLNIISILTAGREILTGVRRLVLQPMSDAGALRRWLMVNGWQLVDERLVKEEGRFYTVLAAEAAQEKLSCSVVGFPPLKKGQEEEWYELMLDLGPLLVARRDPLLREYLGRLIAEHQRAMRQMYGNQRPEVRARLLHFGRRLHLMEELQRELAKQSGDKHMEVT